MHVIADVRYQKRARIVTLKTQVMPDKSKRLFIRWCQALRRNRIGWVISLAKRDLPSNSPHQICLNSFGRHPSRPKTQE